MTFDVIIGKSATRRINWEMAEMVRVHYLFIILLLSRQKNYLHDIWLLSFHHVG